MKHLNLVAMAAVLAVLSGTALQAHAKKASKNAIAPSEASLSTEMRFTGSQVSGAYQVPLEALSVADNEKPLDELLGLRTHFRDREAKAKSLLKGNDL